MTRKELYNICHDEAVAYANSEQWSKRTGEEKSFLIQGYLDAMMEARKSEITEKKKEYPKTYEECCKVMNYCCNPVAVKTTHKEELIRKFQFLLFYRDAYWKIAGEEMGLGKPWEPDFRGVITSYVITVESNKILKSWTTKKQVILAFPTPEMRDAFRENFDPDIEFCKEFL